MEAYIFFQFDKILAEKSKFVHYTPAASPWILQIRGVEATLIWTKENIWSNAICIGVIIKDQ